MSKLDTPAAANTVNNKSCAIEATLDAQTVSEAIYTLWRNFEEAGLDSPRLDARLLVIGATGVSREALVQTPDLVLTDEQRSRIARYQHQRLSREPVSRVLGHRGFYGRTFEISPATLDPRPETETVIECVLDYVKVNALSNKPLRVLDVGTGSGILLLTVLAELPNATGVGTDVSQDALDVAARNANALGLKDRATFLCLDGLAECAGPFDILMSNPPYIATNQIADLAPEVRDFDPHLALDGGADGLAFYRAMASHISRVVPQGLTVFEIGYDQCDDVVDILKSHHERHRNVQITVKKDLAGHERCVALQTLP